jgi:hypothetical protein
MDLAMSPTRIDEDLSVVYFTAGIAASFSIENYSQEKLRSVNLPQVYIYYFLGAGLRDII